MNSLPEIYYVTDVRLKVLYDKLDALFKERFPTLHAREFLKLLRKGAERLSSFKERCARDFQNGIYDKENTSKFLIMISYSVSRLYSCLEYLEFYRYERTRAEIILPLHYLIQQITKDTSKDIFIFHSQYNYNFTFLNFKSELKEILFLSKKEADIFFKDYPNQIAIISFPMMERDNVLVLVLLLHEISHYIDKIHQNISETAISQIKEPVNYQPLIQNWINEAKRIKYLEEETLPLFKTLKDAYYSSIIGKKIENLSTWLTELTADIISTKVVGLAFYLSAKEILSATPYSYDSSYPPHLIRFYEIANQIIANNDLEEINELKNNYNTIMDSINADILQDAEPLDKKIISPPVEPTSPPPKKKEYLDIFAVQTLLNALQEPLRNIKNKINEVLNEKGVKLSTKLLVGVELLNENIPPSERLQNFNIKEPLRFNIKEILNITWISWLVKKLNINSDKDYYRSLQIHSRLTLRAIDLSHISSSYKVDEELAEELYCNSAYDKGENRKLEMGGVLSKADIFTYLFKDNIKDALIITPILEASQITEASFDVRLGNNFIIIKRARAESLNLSKDGVTSPFEYQEKVNLNMSQTIVLHPNELILGSTLEYICIPNDIIAYVIGKSSIGRLGLVIATATHIGPGYRGTPTLELINLGNVPIVIKPGLKIAQLVFHTLISKVDKPYSEKGEYAFSTGPEFSKLLLRG